MTRCAISSMYSVARLRPSTTNEVCTPSNYLAICINAATKRCVRKVTRKSGVVRVASNVTKNREANTIPDIQFGFCPCPKTLQPLFILQCLQHAAQIVRPNNSSRLHAANIQHKDGKCWTAQLIKAFQ
eukprot:15171-Pelagomonas_calceolata.AAC.3